MDVFDLRLRLVEDYARYTRSFIKIADPRICEKVDGALNDGALWPEPLLQLNPTFFPGGTIEDLVADGTLHPECAKIFRVEKSDKDLHGKQLFLYAHQTPLPAGLRPNAFESGFGSAGGVVRISGSAHIYQYVDISTTY